MKFAKIAMCMIVLCGRSVAAHEIDYVLLFTNQAAAQADATMASAWWDGTNWRGDTTFPGLTFISSQSLSGWMIMISSNGSNAALAVHPKTILVLDRDIVALGGTFVIAAPRMTTAGHTSLRFFPIPQGSRYPSPLGQ